MILYKYREDNEFTEQIFSKKKVWLSNAEMLNDPFECTITEIAGAWIKEQVNTMKSAQMAGFIIGAISV
jgi:hypothetical protein